MWRLVRSRFARLGLQRRIMLYVSVGLVAFSAIYGFVALQAIRQSSDLVFRERLLVARALARELDGSLAHMQGELADTSTSIAPQLAAGNNAAAQDALRTLHNHWVSYHHFENPCVLSLTDPDGTVLLSEPAGPTGSLRDLAQSPYLRGAFESQHPLIADEVGDASGNAMVALVLPIQLNQKTIGFIVGEIDRSHMGSTLEPDLSVVDPGYAVELIDSSGVVIASNQKAKQLAESNHRELVAPLFRVGEAGVRTHTFQLNGEEHSHVVAFAPLTQTRWGVIVEQEVDEAFLLPHNLQIEFIGFGVLALLGGLALAWLTTRTVVHPVNALIHASQEIAHGDLEHPLDISGSDEVGTLARSFDEMRVELRESREEIAGWNRELEARVEQRTRELRALVESSHALTSTLELDALFDILMNRINDILPAAEAAVLFLFEAERKKLAVRSTFGFDVSACANLRFELNEAIGGQTFQSQAPALLKTAAQVAASQGNLSTENREHFTRALGDREVQSALGVPLVSKGACLGALVIYNLSRETAFTEGDVPVLQALADQAAEAIENARLYQEAREVGALRELNRLKSEFVARASHELRTPMTAIKSLAETLLRPDLELDEGMRREFLEGIDSATDRLSRIVNQLLMLSRVEAGRLEMQNLPMDVGAIVGRVVEQFRAQSPQRVIEVAASPVLPRAQGDAERVEDVLTNLVSNALKYSLGDAPVAISAQAQDGMVVVAVRDAGMGIPAEARDKVFERFYRVDNAVTRRIGGAGLGLHLCKTYVEAMGGTINVESEEGRGSIFRFTLPRANEAS